ncbi:BolA protein [Glaciecola punicea ACAM 611]|uniref:DNA-binding transcriptional regulator BolA n=1 Tax=Glaciecola punicea ACAM 611 TaxID=1121923 RepID=H5TEF2_9ALTE|nr:BolA/IbaG family iron-sulfur metabolism protein [Glaciecola punicea]OFA32340.1 transcriptional regulator BolA [Glaciecola punicea]GAB56679.1 BolA protein [Glaciecola punicea ACAM 611]
MNTKTTIQTVVTEKLNAKFLPRYLEVLNESHMHNVPENSETHFKVTVVSDAFEQKRLIQRHRMVNALLSEELAGSVHALALHTYTADDWAKKQGSAPTSPNCLGGSGK